MTIINEHFVINTNGNNDIIDIYNDGKLELILSKGYYDNLGSCEVIYRLKNNKFVSINECNLINN